MPSFILAILASGSLFETQSWFESFLPLRLRSRRGRYFRMHLVGYFEGIDSERGLSSRRNSRSDRESEQRHSRPRSESMPSK